MMKRLRVASQRVQRVQELISERRCADEKDETCPGGVLGLSHITQEETFGGIDDLQGVACYGTRPSPETRVAF